MIFSIHILSSICNFIMNFFEHIPFSQIIKHIKFFFGPTASDQFTIGHSLKLMSTVSVLYNL